MGAKILVVEDDAGTAETLHERRCARKAMSANMSPTGATPCTWPSASDFDAVIMDRMLPGMDGLSVLKALRAAGIHTPLLNPLGPRRARRAGEGPARRRRRLPDQSPSPFPSSRRASPSCCAGRRGARR
jgi:DNA-binding NtrC family response regulator